MTRLIKLSKLPNGYAERPDSANYMKILDEALSQVHTLEIEPRSDGYAVKAYTGPGRQISNPVDAINDWIKNLMMDPETKVAKFGKGLAGTPTKFAAGLIIMNHEYSSCYPLVASPFDRSFTLAVC